MRKYKQVTKGIEHIHITAEPTGFLVLVWTILFVCLLICLSLCWLFVVSQFSYLLQSFTVMLVHLLALKQITLIPSSPNIYCILVMPICGMHELLQVCNTIFVYALRSLIFLYGEASYMFRWALSCHYYLCIVYNCSFFVYFLVFQLILI